MSLSRKHYNELSEILKDNLIDYNTKDGQLIFNEDLKRQLLSFLKRDNRNFDKDRFVEASNLERPADSYEPIKHYGDEPAHVSNVIDTALDELNIKLS